MRRIKYYDNETHKELVFLTNNTDLEAIEIAMLYKKRWEVELFFKWMKQHLRIKSFAGTKHKRGQGTDLLCGHSVLLVAIIGNKLKSRRRIYEILQILSISLLDKTPVREVLKDYDYKDVKKLNSKQLKINGFYVPTNEVI